MFGGLGGAPPAPKSKLEQMLEKALKNNPDLRVAAAKVQEAEAELNRTRLEVTRKVLRTYSALDAAKKNAEGAEQRLAEVRKLADHGRIDKEEVKAAERALGQAKAELAAAEAEVPYLLGEEPVPGRHGGVVEAVAFTPDGRHLVTSDGTSVKVWDVARAAPASKPPQGPVADRILKALDMPVQQLDYNGKTLDGVLKDIEEKYNLTFATPGRDRQLAKVNLHVEGLPLGAVLQAISDQTGVRFVVRDYGILALFSAQPPDDAVPLHEFWKAHRGAAKPAAPAAKPGEAVPPK
jgi:hypothetical protein